jgi:hypothetical protein
VTSDSSDSDKAVAATLMQGQARPRSEVFEPPAQHVWHPENLYKHVIDLEGLFTDLGPTRDRERAAVAKAIASAAGSFLEGTLFELIQQVFERNASHLGGLAMKWNKRLRSKRPPGLGETLTSFEDVVKAINPGATITRPSYLYGVRNAVDHGDLIQPGALHFDDPKFFRRQAYDYLATAYQAVGISPPGWLLAP